MSSEQAVNATPVSSTGYAEKLWPNLWAWIIVLGISTAGILIFIPISPLAGIIAFFAMLAIQTVLLVLSTPKIEVTDTTLQVGRAVIELDYVGQVSVHQGEDATAQRGPKLNGLAYLCFRGWVKDVVKIEITDPADKTPYWLTSSRNPDHLAAAIRAAKKSR